MDWNGLTEKPGNKAGCPAEIELDLAHWGELAPSRARVVDRHIEKCSLCRKRMELRRKGFDAVEGTDVGGMFAGIQQALEGEKIPDTVMKSLRDIRLEGRKPTSPDRGHGLNAGWQALSPRWACLAAALILFVVAGVFIFVPSASEGDLDVVRYKGAIKLIVYRERGGGVAEAFSGAVLHPGDRLRFEIDMPFDGHVLILGVERGGKTYLLYPAEGKPGSRFVPKGKGKVLPGAARLDDSLGREWIHLVACLKPFSSSDIGLKNEANQIEIGSGCLSAPFEIRKEEP